MTLDSGHSRLSHVSRQANRSGAWQAVLSKHAFDTAATQISNWADYQATPLIELNELANEWNVGQILFKDESGRFDVGSFKALGAPYAACQTIYRALSSSNADQSGISPEAIASGHCQKACSAITVAAATDGNHGRALAWGARRFGAKCRIYIHAEVSEFRENAMTELGATVVRIDGDYDESVRFAREQADKNGWFVVSDTSWDGYTETPTQVMAGYGLMVDETVAQCSQPPTHTMIQGGVGGLAAAVFARLEQRYPEQAIRKIVVEPEYAACLQASARNESLSVVGIDQETIMAGLSCGEPSVLAWTVLADLATDFITIPDELVAPAMRLLGKPPGADPAIVAGESAVAGLAALHAACNDPVLKQELDLNETSRVLLIGTEGNTDPMIYQQLMATQ